MNSPFSVSDNGKLARRVSRWRLAAAVGTVTVIGATTAVALPANAAVASPAAPGTTCVTYHDWTVCIGFDGTYTSVSGESSINRGTHSLFLQINGDSATLSESFNFTAGTTHGFTVPVTPSSSAKSWGGIDVTRIVGVVL